MNKTTTPTNSSALRKHNSSSKKNQMLTTDMMTVEKAGGEKRNLLKRSLEVVGNLSQRRLKETIEKVSNHGLIPLNGTESSTQQPELRRLKRYVKIHNEQSPSHCFEVGYTWYSGDDNGKGKSSDKNINSNRKMLCIGCKECSYKIFPHDGTTKMLETYDGNNHSDKENEKKWNLEEEARILADMEDHVTKHYVTFAKIILWIMEAFFALIVNYYNQ